MLFFILTIFYLFELLLFDRAVLTFSTMIINFKIFFEIYKFLLYILCLNSLFYLIYYILSLFCLSITVKQSLNSGITHNIFIMFMNSESGICAGNTGDGLSLLLNLWSK